MKVVTLGDAALDVLVELQRLPVPDDDVPARITLAAGGQAANVAAWCAALGAQAAVITRLGDDLPGAFVRAELERRGVQVLAGRSARTATIGSFVTPDRLRSMASDRGGQARRPDDACPLEDESWPVGCSWLHVSGYELLDASSDGEAAIAVSATARNAGASVSVDLSARTVVEALGATETARRLAATGASVVFATEAELDAAGGLIEDGGPGVLVVKRGAAGCRIRERGAWRDVAAAPATVRDPTGAGDALAAGWIVGGEATALRAAACCVGQLGAFPPA